MAARNSQRLQFGQAAGALPHACAQLLAYLLAAGGEDVWLAPLTRGVLLQERSPERRRAQAVLIRSFSTMLDLDAMFTRVVRGVNRSSFGLSGGPSVPVAPDCMPTVNGLRWDTAEPGGAATGL